MLEGLVLEHSETHDCREMTRWEVRKFLVFPVRKRSLHFFILFHLGGHHPLEARCQRGVQIVMHRGTLQ